MPELPEVQTTVDGINEFARGLAITDVWNDYKSPHHIGKDNIKDPDFYASFRKAVIGAKIEKASRRAKNVLIHLSNGNTIIIHMKMTGHVLYGAYKKIKTSGKESWIAAEAGPLRDDPFNRHVRLVFSLSNGKHLALSDMRRFAKVTFAETSKLEASLHLSASGPEPLEKDFTAPALKERLSRRLNGPVKTVLMDHSIVAGIGNIYSDEILWRTGLHPLTKVKDIPAAAFTVIWKAMRETLAKGIDFGGDSMSDYRNILGKSGEFQDRHNAYRKTGSRCSKKGCKGTIQRLKIGGRSAHFCDVHQILARS